MPGPNSRPSTYEYKPLDMAAGLQVRQSLQKKYEDTQGQLQEQKILAYDTLKNSLFDPAFGENMRKEFDDIYNSAIDSLQTQEDIPQALDAIRKAQDKLYLDPKVQFYKTMVATEEGRAEWQIQNPEGYAPLEKIPYDQLFQMQQEGKVNIPDLLSARVGAPDYFNETKAYLGSIPQIQDLLQDDKYTLDSVSTWITSFEMASALDKQSELGGKPTRQHRDAYYAFKSAVYSAVDNGNTNGARKEKLMSQFEQNYQQDPREAYYKKLQEIAPAFSRQVQTLSADSSNSSDKATTGGGENIVNVKDAVVIPNNARKILENKDQYSKSQIEYAEIAAERLRDKTKEVMQSASFKDLNIDEDIVANILSSIQDYKDLDDASDQYLAKIGGLGGSTMDPFAAGAEFINNGIAQFLEFTEGLDNSEFSQSEFIQTLTDRRGPIGVLPWMVSSVFRSLQPKDYYQARQAIIALKDSDLVSPENLRNLIEPITQYKVHFDKAADKTAANDFLKTYLDADGISEVQAYDKNGRSTTVPVTSSDMFGIVGILKDNLKMDWAEGAKFEERGGNLQISVSISNSKINEVLEADPNSMSNLTDVIEMVKANPGGSTSFKWNENIDGELAQRYLNEEDRKMIKASNVYHNLSTVPEVNGVPTTDSKTEYVGAMTKINELQGTNLKLDDKYEDSIINVDPVYMDIYNSSGEPVTEKAFRLYVGDTPVTINEVFQKESRNLDEDDLTFLAKSLESFGKNEKVITELRAAREDFKKGKIKAGDFRPYVEAAMKDFGKNPFNFTNKLRVLMYLSKEQD
jgi:hypothetical protein